MKEKWLDIPGWWGTYQVSNLARVRSFPEVTIKWGRKFIAKGRTLKQHLHKTGYWCVGLGRKAKTRVYKVHRLLAMAFVHNPYNKPHVNHKNGIKTDNSLENLEWCTPQENIKHAFRIGLKSQTGDLNSNHKITKDDARAIRKRARAGENQQVLSKEYGLDDSTISAIKLRKIWKHA